jgi:putative membrane protein
MELMEDTMGMRRSLILLILGIVPLIASCAALSERKAAGNPDAMFLLSTARGSNAEIALSQLAAERSQDPDVKQFARQVTEDHHRINMELEQLASRRELSIPTAPDELHEKTAAHLSQLSGQDFDKEYVTEMVADHAKMLTKFQNKAKLAQDSQIRQWAASQVPAFRDHYEAAHALNAKLLASRSHADETPNR